MFRILNFQLVLKAQFDILQVTRNNVIAAVKDISNHQLNYIPEGFNNNIIWNIAHLVATQQLLVYGLTKTPFVVPKPLIDANRKGTKPSMYYSQTDTKEIIEYLTTTTIQMEMDYNSGVFSGKPFKTYTTSYNVTLKSVEDAIAFNNVHEGMHYGIIKMMKRFL